MVVVILTPGFDQPVSLFGIHSGFTRTSVRNWCKQGLEPIDEKRPILIRGQMLADPLLSAGRTTQTCGPGLIYCLPCRAEVPAEKMADCIQTGETCFASGHRWTALGSPN